MWLPHARKFAPECIAAGGIVYEYSQHKLGWHIYCHLLFVFPARALWHALASLMIPALLKLYTALIHPHIEYGAQVWNPHQEKDIQCLEKVQKLTLQMCAKDYHASYLHLLVLYIITQKQKILFVSMYFYSFVNELVHFPQLNTVHPPMSSSPKYNPHAQGHTQYSWKGGGAHCTKQILAHTE